MVAPGGAIGPEALEPGLAWLRRWGWEPVLGPSVLVRHRYLAGPRDQRAADVQWALTAPDLDAVWFARGGYGTSQILRSLDWASFARRPVIGFSDASGLLWALARRGLPAIHGPVLSTLGDPPRGTDEQSRAVLHRLLTTGEGPVLAAEHLLGPTHAVTGRVIGGNLAVLASLAGTPEALRCDGDIVVLEDVGEAPYRLERALCQLIDSGALHGAAGIALGDFSTCEPQADAGYTLAEIWRDHLAPLGIPVVHGLPVGHGTRNHAFHYAGVASLTPQGLQFTSSTSELPRGGPGRAEA